MRAVNLPAEREAPLMKEGLSEAEVLERQEGHLDGEYVGAVADECGDDRDGGVTQHVLVALTLYEPVLLSGAHTATGQLAEVNWHAAVRTAGGHTWRCRQHAPPLGGRLLGGIAVREVHRWWRDV